MTSEFKVGLVVLIGIVLLFYMSFRVGKFGSLSGGYHLVTHFANSAGLDPKSPVEIAGVEVGVIRQITLEGNRAKLDLRIKEGINIPTDSQVSIKSFGILGDKYLSIAPGQAKTYFKSDDEIKKVAEYADYDEIFSNISVAAKNFGDTLSQFKGIIGEEDKSNLRESLSNVKAITGDFKQMVADNKENVTHIVNNFAQASDRLGPIVDRADATFAGINSIVQGIQEGKGSLGLLVTDDKLYNDTKDTMASFKTISSDIEQGKGTLGKLVTDETLYTDAQASMKNIREITDGINKGEGSLGKIMKDESLITEADKTMKKIQRAADSVQEQVPITVLGTIFGILF